MLTAHDRSSSSTVSSSSDWRELRAWLATTMSIGPSRRTARVHQLLGRVGLAEVALVDGRDRRRRARRRSASPSPHDWSRSWGGPALAVDLGPVGEQPTSDGEPDAGPAADARDERGATAQRCHADIVAHLVGSHLGVSHAPRLLLGFLLGRRAARSSSPRARAARSSIDDHADDEHQPEELVDVHGRGSTWFDTSSPSSLGARPRWSVPGSRVRRRAVEHLPAGPASGASATRGGASRRRPWPGPPPG